MKLSDILALYTATTTHRSKERDRYSAARLLQHFQDRDISAIRRADVRAYITARTEAGVQPATVARELRHLCAAINHVRIEHEIQLPNPVQRVGITEPEARVRWITRDEAAELLRRCDEYARTPHLYNFIRLALNTGCRRSELLGLEWSRVDLQRRLLLLQAEHTKAGKRRTVPLNDEAMQALRDQHSWVHARWPASPWVFATGKATRLTTVQKSFSSACRRARIEDFRVHDLRHTFASWLVMQGVSLYVIKDLLGHSSITMTEKYAHLSTDQRISAVQLLPRI